MKRNTLMILGLMACVMSASAQTNGPADYSKLFKSDKERDSYAVGMYFGNNIKGLVSQETNTVDIKLIEKALLDTANGVPPMLTPQQDHEIITAYQTKVKSAQREKQMAQAKAEGETNSKAGMAFLAKNKTQPGVITLANGLQYKILKTGEGDKPKADDLVTVTYRGTHVDGTEFDSGTHEFQANRVIPGWTQALQLMPVGSKWQIFIPSDLAYGERGRPPVIGPDETLLFDVELTSTKPAPPAAPVPPSQMTSDIIKVPSAEGLKHGEKIETIKASDVGKMGTKTNN